MRIIYNKTNGIVLIFDNDNVEIKPVARINHDTSTTLDISIDNVVPLIEEETQSDG